MDQFEIYLLPRCTYCCKPYPEEQLKPLNNEDKPHLNRRYCPKCLPDIKQEHNKLPWIRIR